MEPNEDYELRRVLHAWQVQDAPPELEGRVMSARPANGRYHGTGWRATLAALAATAALVAIGVLLSGIGAQPTKSVAPPARLLSVEDDGEAPFVPVPYVAPLDSYETATGLRMNVPVASLISAGYRMTVMDPTAIVLADILVGDDGRAHAVRLVNGSNLQNGG